MRDIGGHAYASELFINCLATSAVSAAQVMNATTPPAMIPCTRSETMFLLSSKARNFKPREERGDWCVCAVFGSIAAPLQNHCSRFHTIFLTYRLNISVTDISMQAEVRAIKNGVCSDKQRALVSESPRKLAFRPTEFRALRGRSYA